MLHSLLKTLFTAALFAFKAYAPYNTRVCGIQLCDASELITRFESETCKKFAEIFPVTPICLEPNGLMHENARKLRLDATLTSLLMLSQTFKSTDPKLFSIFDENKLTGFIVNNFHDGYEIYLATIHDVHYVDDILLKLFIEQPKIRNTFSLYVGTNINCGIISNAPETEQTRQLNFELTQETRQNRWKYQTLPPTGDIVDTKFANITKIWQPSLRDGFVTQTLHALLQQSHIEDKLRLRCSKFIHTQACDTHNCETLGVILNSTQPIPAIFASAIFVPALWTIQCMESLDDAHLCLHSTGYAHNKGCVEANASRILNMKLKTHHTETIKEKASQISLFSMRKLIEQLPSMNFRCTCTTNQPAAHDANCMAKHIINITERLLNIFNLNIFTSQEIFELFMRNNVFEIECTGQATLRQCFKNQHCQNCFAANAQRIQSALPADLGLSFAMVHYLLINEVMRLDWCILLKPAVVKAENFF